MKPTTDLLAAVLTLVEQTGTFQLEHFRTFAAGAGSEKQARELVSAVDVESEQRLIEGLGRLLPEAGFYGEESGLQGDRTLRWVIDPLDGTTNYLSGLDQFCISVALEREGRSELGVVWRPASAESFSAVRGAGLFYNRRRCRRVPPLALQQALVGTGFPYRSEDLADPFFACAREVLYRCRGIRRFGSAALDLCYVAAGFLQGFWETDLQPYDVAAALLFLEESGCVTSNEHGVRYSPYDDRILVAGFPGVHAELLPLISSHYAPPPR
ncbi:MAG: inositol monophosphatase family protein [Pelovirga sp.]